MEHVATQVSRAELRAYSDQQTRELAARFEVEGHFDPYRYVPPGPVAQRFILSSALTAVIMGPLGGGKTTACTFKRIYSAIQAPIAWHPEDGKPTRMCRWPVLRDTFRSAEKTVLESWKQWFPKGYPGSTWTGGNDRPVTHTLRFLGQDGIRIEAVTEFAGLGEHSIEELFKGREYSGSWANELDTHAEGALDDLEQRVGRYPKADLLLTPDQLAELSRERGKIVTSSGRRLRTVIGDMNAPTIDNWTHKTLVLKNTPDRILFRQPSGRSAEAENVFNLEPDYYERIVRNQDEHFVRRMVDNEFGYSRAGKAVYDGFNASRHVQPAGLDYRPELDLHIGVDASTSGLSPAAVFAQAWGPRIACLDELYLGHGVGPARFAEALKLKIEQRFQNVRRLVVWIDPAAQYGADREGGQLAALEIFQVVLGVPVLVPANGSNEIGMRLDAVKAELRGYLEPNSSFIIDGKRCPLLVEGMAGKYRYKKLAQTASNEYEDLPEKLHPWSDVQDGAQYVVLGIRGRSGALHGAGTGRSQKGSSVWGASGQAPARRGGFDPHRAGA